MLLKTTAIGTLGRDAEQIGELELWKFSIAVSNGKKNEEEKTYWVDCLIKFKGLIPYLLKGAKVYIEGFPQAKAYTNKEGTAMANLVVNVNQIEILKFVDSGNQGSYTPSSNQEEPLPF